jgi:ligand-binding SRPBCC domain-containing protein
VKTDEERAIVPRPFFDGKYNPCMTEIYLETFIDAPVERCFDLARSIDLHELSAARSKEKAIAGKTGGLIEKDEFVTWEAKHFGIRQTLSGRIVEMDRPRYFCDEMTRGAFKSLHHEHFFEDRESGTLMIDKFCYETPFWIFGKIFNSLILKKYMTRFLADRNRIIKRVAESNEWRKFLN